MKTGIFFHEIFNKKTWHIINDKFRNFPNVIEDQIRLDNVKLIEPPRVNENLLKKVHTENFVENLKNQWYWKGAFYTIGGCIKASEMIIDGELLNALVFGVAAGHHAEKDVAWGGTYASVSGPLVRNLQNKFPDLKIAILDTDSHHGNGTRQFVKGNKNVLHVCFCSTNSVEENGTKICVDSGYNVSDAYYLDLVEKEFMRRLDGFNPDIILHLLGHDTAVGDYGNRGLSKEFFIELVRKIKRASKICNGKYLINSHGGSNLDVCEYIFPRIIEVLAER
jgi:acetoin utilization deacetylase AcuC-like enzyme